MRTFSSSARSRGRATVVAVLVAVGVLACVGVGQAAVSSPAPAAAAPGGGDTGGDGAVCADGKRDDNPADGVCTRDHQGDAGNKQSGDGGSDAARSGQGGQGGQKAKDGDGTVCADGRRDNNPADGVCTRDGKHDQPAADPDLVAGTPCTKSAHACADLAGKKAWLIQDGKVVRGPVPITSGAPGYETPRGTFAVQWKSKDYRSMEFDNAPMPFSVFFTDGGIAFHEGSLSRESHGCIHLGRADAEAFFNFLNPDDEVQVH